MQNLECTSSFLNTTHVVGIQKYRLNEPAPLIVQEILLHVYILGTQRKRLNASFPFNSYNV